MARNTVEVLINLLKQGTGDVDAVKGLAALRKAGDSVKAVMASQEVQAIKTVYEFGRLGAESLRTRNAFTAISGGMGEATNRLDAMKRATRGAISEQDAMAAANKLMQMGLADSAEALEKTTTFAVRLGAAMGKDATQSLEEWSLMMANQSIPRLDTFGVSASKVRARMLELKASVAGMSREQAFNIAVTEQAEASLERLGEAAEDPLLQYERMEAQMADLKATLAEGVAPAMGDFIGLLNVGVQEATHWGDRIKQAYGGLAAWALNAVGAKDAAIGLLDGMGLLDKSIPIEVMEHAATLTDGWMASLAPVPGVVGEASGALDGLSTSASKVAKSFGEMTFDDEQLWKMAMASGASLDQLGILAEHLGIATDAEVEHTLEAYKMVEAFGQGTMTAEELRDSFTDLATEELAATQAAAEASGEIEYLRGGMVEAEGAAGEMAVAFDETAVILSDVEMQAQQVALALEAIPRKVDIEVTYHEAGVPGMQHGGVWPGGVGWVGEAGPELAVFPRGTRIVPAWESRQVARSTTDNRSWSRGGDTIIVQDALAMAMVLEEKRRETSRRLRRGM